MHDGHVLLRAASVWVRRKSTLAVAIGGLLALLLWTIPNRETFWQHASQLPVLWQTPANRQSIVSLVIKILSPLFIMGMITLALWIFSLVKTEVQEAREPDQVRPPEVITLPADHGQSFSAQVQQQGGPDQGGLFSAQPVQPFSQAPPPQSAARSPQIDPVTPPPLVMPSTEALREFLTTTGSLEQSGSPQLSQPLTREDESSQKETQAIVPPAPSSSLPLEIAHPVIVAKGRITASDPLISIRLLGEVSLALCVPGRGQVTVPLSSHTRRIQLLAYLAWKRGDLTDREKILEQIFGWGIPDEEATEDKLSERFESNKKLLRKKIREVVAEQINIPAGKTIIDPDIDPFVSDAGFWGLSEICRVDDLEEVERCFRVIALARKEGTLRNTIPEEVKQACDQLITAYTGDFLATIINKHANEFRAWQGRSSWARRPYTQYRDSYLSAVWYAAAYEWQQGQRSANNEHTVTREDSVSKQQEHFSRAAQLYETYAMYACNTKFDAKVSFGPHGEYGERVGMSERALRRCVVLFGVLGRTDLINQVWSAYCKQMKAISDQRWQPSKETQDDVQAAMAQTDAYRFSAQISQLSSDFSERQGPLP
jgi:hypothetical protein